MTYNKCISRNWKWFLTIAFADILKQCDLQKCSEVSFHKYILKLVKLELKLKLQSIIFELQNAGATQKSPSQESNQEPFYCEVMQLVELKANGYYKNEQTWLLSPKLLKTYRYFKIYNWQFA